MAQWTESGLRAAQAAASPTLRVTRRGTVARAAGPLVTGPGQFKWAASRQVPGGGRGRAAAAPAAARPPCQWYRDCHALAVILSQWVGQVPGQAAAPGRPRPGGRARPGPGYAVRRSLTVSVQFKFCQSDDGTQ